MALSSPTLSSFLHSLHPYWDETCSVATGNQAVDLETSLQSHSSDNSNRQPSVFSSKNIVHSKQWDSTDDTTTWEAHWDTETLKLLLGITDGDIEQLYQEGGSTVSALISLDDSHYPFTIENQTDNNGNGNLAEALTSDQSPSFHHVLPLSEGSIKRPDVKENFVHPGFYTLPSSAPLPSTFASSLSSSSSSLRSYPTPKPTACKRSWQEQEQEQEQGQEQEQVQVHEPGQDGSLVENGFIPYNQNHKRTDLGHNSPLLYAADLRRHSVDDSMSMSTPPYVWAYATPPKTPSMPSSLFRGLLANYPALSSSSFSSPFATVQDATSFADQCHNHIQQHGHQHRHYTELPPGQPFVAATTTLDSPSLMSSALFTRHQHLQETKNPNLITKTGSVGATGGRGAGARTARRQSTTPRKRRASKFSIPGASFHERQRQQDSLERSSSLSSLASSSNAQLPPPLQHRYSSTQIPSHYSLYAMLPEQNSQQLKQQEQQQQPTLIKDPPQACPKAIQELRMSSSRGTSYRRNPGEVPASTLPPDHFVFQEALVAMNRLHESRNINSDDSEGSSSSNTNDVILGNDEPQGRVSLLCSSSVAHSADNNSIIGPAALHELPSSLLTLTQMLPPRRRQSEPCYSMSSNCLRSPPGTSITSPNSEPDSNSEPESGLESEPVLENRSMMRALFLSSTTTPPSWALSPESQQHSSSTLVSPPSMSMSMSVSPSGLSSLHPIIVDISEGGIRTLKDGNKEGKEEDGEEEEEDMSAAAIFAKRLTTVAPLDPAATKLMNQLTSARAFVHGHRVL